MVSAALLHSSKSMLASLCLVMSFSSWILASINIHKIHNVYGGYNRTDPAFLVIGVLGMLWFLSLVVLGGHRYGAHKAKMVLIITTLITLYYLATAISYTATRYKGTYNCPATPADLRAASGCSGLIRALQAFAWTDFVLCLLYTLVIFLMAKKHTTLPWTDREDGMNTDVDHLCPSDTRIEGKKEDTGAHHV